MAVMSSTAVAVDVNRWIDFSFNLGDRRIIDQFLCKTRLNERMKYSLLAFSGLSNSFHRSALSIFAESVTLNRQ